MYVGRSREAVVRIPILLKNRNRVAVVVSIVMPIAMFVQAKAYTATVPETDARRARMIPPGLGPCSHVVWWRRRLRGRSRAGSWARGRLRCQLRCRLGGRLSALSESARA